MFGIFGKKDKAKENQDCGIPLSEDMLANCAGGFSSGFNDLARLKVHCPINGCNFECNTFGEMNIHMRQNHPEHC